MEIIDKIIPYLPYDLGFKATDLESGEFEESCITEINFATAQIEVGATMYSFDDIGSNELKPVLRPLEDLVKEISFNNKRFIPLTELKDSGLWCDAYDDWWDLQEPDYKTMMRNCPYEIFDKLLEWNFDVFSLIDDGRAINMNKL